MAVQTTITIFLKQFSLKEANWKTLNNFMPDVLALLFALYLLSWFYSLMRNIVYTI